MDMLTDSSLTLIVKTSEQDDANVLKNRGENFNPDWNSLKNAVFVTKFLEVWWTNFKKDKTFVMVSLIILSQHLWEFKKAIIMKFKFP